MAPAASRSLLDIASESRGDLRRGIHREDCIRRLRGELTALGPALAGSHRSLRDDYEVSCAELDVAVEAAVAGGAVAARMTGGGFGGSALALTPIAAVDLVIDSVSKAFGEAGFGPPSIFAVEVAAAADRVS